MSNKFFQFLGLTKKAGKLLEGYNRCEESFSKVKIYLAILSEDASDNTKSKFRKYCEENKVPLLEGPSKENLGFALGKSEIKILCVTDKRMSEKLLQLWKESKD